MKQIVAAVDCPEFASSVVERAASLTAAYSAGLTILPVAAPDPDFVGYAAGPQSVRDARAHNLREEHRQFLTMAESCREQAIEAKAHLVDGPTVETILREAQRADAGMIVIGSTDTELSSSLHRARWNWKCQRGGPQRGSVLVVPATVAAR